MKRDFFIDYVGIRGIHLDRHSLPKSYHVSLLVLIMWTRILRFLLTNFWKPVVPNLYFPFWGKQFLILIIGFCFSCKRFLIHTVSQELWKFITMVGQYTDNGNQSECPAKGNILPKINFFSSWKIDSASLSCFKAAWPCFSEGAWVFSCWFWKILST